MGWIITSRDGRLHIYWKTTSQHISSDWFMPETSEWQNQMQLNHSPKS
jgi:hypothetical protein